MLASSRYSSLVRGIVSLVVFSLVVALCATVPNGVAAAADHGLSLNGSSQYATLGAASDLRSATFTVELWFKRTGAGVGTSTGTGGIASAIPLITKGRAEAETAAADVNYFFGIDATSGTLVADFEEAQTGANPSMNHPVAGTTAIAADGSWHHAAATYDGTTWYLYLDGVQDGTATVGQPANAATNALTSVGSARTTSGTAAGFFAGVIDEVRIWDVARSQGQISAAKDTEITSPQTDLLGVWNLNEGTGSSLADSSGNAITGAAVGGPAWVDGFTVGPPPPGNYGLSLNGSSQYATLGAASDLRSATFTVELWFKRTGAGVGTSTGTGGIASAIPLITKGRAEAETAAADVNYFFGIDATSGTLVADFEEAQTGANPSMNHPVAGTTAIAADGSWHHAAATYDGTTWYLYLDGVQDGTATVGQPANAATNALTSVGSARTTSGTAAGFFAGVIDEVRIWDVARSQGQISAAKDTEITSPQTDLLGVWNLNEGTGSSLADSSGNAITGAAVGGPGWVDGFVPPSSGGNPPDAPTLNAPADGATGVATSPTLDVGVSDPDGDPLTVTYYGRPYASGNFATIAAHSGVTSSGDTATWSSLGAGQEFEWYVTVSDGTDTVTGPTWTFRTAPGPDPVFVGVGDISTCDNTNDSATAAVVQGVDGTIFTVGDNVYPTGSADNFTNCYDPSWGIVKARTRPIPGNHDWGTGVLNSLDGYFGYFGSNATDADGNSYYSYDIPSSNWHIVNLDSECALVPGGCGTGSAQELWLKADLAANITKNVIGLFHKPRFSSSATNDAELQPFVDDLYAAGAEMVLVGHDHVYERFAPLDATGTPDATYGMRFFTVGMGGDSHMSFGTPRTGSEVRDASSYGVMKFTLHATSYDWQFLPVAGSTFTDSGTQAVHGPPGGPPADYYVDNTNGSCSDAGPGSSATPFCTIGKAASLAAAGQTVRVLAGTYAETVNGANSGTSGNPITYSAAPGVTVTGATGNGFTVTSKSYIVIDGFTVSDTVGYGIAVSTSNHITVSNNHVSSAGSPVSGSTRMGIYISNTDDSTITGNTTDHNSQDGIRLTGGSSGNLVSNNVSYGNAEEWQRNATGIQVTGAGSDNNTILHNIAYGNEDSGLQFYAAAQNNIVVGNLSYGNGDHGIDNNAAPGNTIVGNTVQGNVTAGINLEGASAPGSGGATIANNIAIDNGLRLLVGGGTASGQPTNIRVDAQSTAGTTLDYDLVYLGSGTGMIQWNGTTYASLAAFQVAVGGQETHGLEADPLLAAPAAIAQRPAVAPFNVAVNVGNDHLTAGSPAIDSANADASNQATLDLDGQARIDDPTTTDTGAGARTYDDRGAYEFRPLLNTALDLGSSGAYVTFGDPAKLDLSAFTVETWFKRTGAGTSNSTGTGGIPALVPLLTHGAPQAENSNVDANWILGISTSGTGTTDVLAADFEEGAGGTTPGLNHPVYGTTVVTNDVWHHAAATYDGTTWNLYLDGNLEATLAVGQPVRSDSIQRVALGAMITSTDTALGRFVGVIDEARVWDHARSGSQIAGDRDNELTSGTGLVARWGLNDASGEDVTDSLPTPANGVVTGVGYGWVDGFVPPAAGNTAPDAPALNAPSDGATGIGASPTLDVTVSDPDADAMTVTYYGRPFASGVFAQIAQHTGVSSGSEDTATWSSLGAGQEFEWYVTLSDGSLTTTGPTWTFHTTPSVDPVFVGVGDIGSCDTTDDTATGLIIQGIEGNVFTTGDNVYPNGTASDFTNCYAPTPWGDSSVLSRTRPIPGNHDWGTGVTENLDGYFGYFGSNATDVDGNSYYSYDIPSSNWHIVNLDSECQLVPGGCGVGSAQELWLKADLAANSSKNVIALWHKPRYSSGQTNLQALQPLWDDLYAGGVDILMDGHDHIYERFVPMKSGATPADPPVADPTYGIQQFTVGMGGEEHHSLGTTLPTSVVRNNDTFGIFKLTLHATTYDWVFLPIDGYTFTDSGTGTVHAAPGASGVGLLRVTTSPALPAQISINGVVADSWGLNWLELAPGSYTVHFSHVEGYSQPADQVVNVTAGTTTTLTGTFTPRGSLRVQTSPAVAGQISVDGVPRDNWGMWTDIPTGAHQVCFGPVEGYIPPSCQDITVTAGVLTSITGTYSPNAAASGASGVGLLRVTTSPALPAQISINGVVADSWGLNWLELAPGSYTVHFSHVEGYSQPADQVVNVTAGTTTTLTGTFTPRGSLRVQTSPAVAGQISVDGVPRDNWGMWTDIPTGAHQVCFGPVEGYIPPSCQDITVTAGVLTSITGTYSPN